ncbi:type II toxin-antitoxin system RelE/ParE family toxin [Mesorhizobium sp. M2A.F.Ca.ET.043.05.1.1]|uniref:type II toxin-antitoxin system RelE/ParE family toxin n=1 Tax=Mesorhizobium sp. M2A.F.Ca.ET.043.05.1.1 TaxID=2493671 RepID=UPI000F75FD18|nr:type II toxin-antitoxin system RelE/ParE family toxin [Mesorhizobium sp. M2A.F.Ca.ET.043.05.1.1]AZO16894.1 type II toxin-antitoxin system RelE/ParE family toxin [Mesorhizobium sp. M2A.F.Ca.ET.043.05.1.1]
MAVKPIIPRSLALRDIEDAVDYYAREAGSHVALGYVDDLQNAYKLIVSYPASGSLRFGYEVGLPGLRSLQLKRYPYLIFYFEQTDHIDVWRVLHAKTDIPVWLQNPGS